MTVLKSQFQLNSYNTKQESYIIIVTSDYSIGNIQFSVHGRRFLFLTNQDIFYRITIRTHGFIILSLHCARRHLKSKEKPTQTISSENTDHLL